MKKKLKKFIEGLLIRAGIILGLTFCSSLSMNVPVLLATKTALLTAGIYFFTELMRYLNIKVEKNFNFLIYE